MKSLASSEISSNASSSKSHVADVTLDSVSFSLSPMNGDNPLTLRERERERKGGGVDKGQSKDRRQTEMKLSDLSGGCATAGCGHTE